MTSLDQLNPTDTSTQDLSIGSAGYIGASDQTPPIQVVGIDPGQGAVIQTEGAVSTPAEEGIRQELLLGSTGGTGASGYTPPTQIIGSYYHQGVTIQTETQLLSNEETIGLYVGTTGGIGNIPQDIETAIKNQETPDNMKHNLVVSYTRLPDNEMVDTLIYSYIKGQACIGKANSIMVIFAFQIGVMAILLMQKIIAGSQKRSVWTKYRRENIDPHIHQNTLSEYMNIAGINNVLQYKHLGIDRLSKLAVMIKDAGMSEDSDPIKTILAEVENSVVMDQVNYRIIDKCEAAIASNKLKKAGINTIPMNKLVNLYSCGFSLDKNDIKKMVEMKSCGKDVLEYIQDKDGTARIQRQEIKKNRHRDVSQKIKDINHEIQKLNETISNTIKLNPSELNLDIHRIDGLIKALNELRNLAPNKPNS